MSIYKEIGTGKRVALAKLAVQTLEKKGRPFRIAVDISIWQFQVQSGKGGSNPALRTLYYRLLILLSLSIQPLFVFDGPNKPPFKRNVKTSIHGASLPNMLAKTMLSLFGFPHITAPGEAEAECALLQQEGIVDAVLSEDVDTIMFGSSMVLRNWSKEATQGNKHPTHVSVYDSRVIREGDSGLDRDGMVLVALMSGGDYIPTGIPGCGIKIACEAARAGFGRDLCHLHKKDTDGLRQWREKLDHELRTNESGHFRQRHKSLQVPEGFPDRVVLRYYTHPVISSKLKISEMRESITWDKPVDVPELRAFVADAFEWQYLSGAQKFIRGLAPALLTQKLRSMMSQVYDNSRHQAHEELKIVRAICGRRTHPSTDGMPELRIAYIPCDMVNLDLTKEETDSYAGLTGAESELETELSELDDQQPVVTLVQRPKLSQFDSSIPTKIYIMETFAKLGVPLMVETWEADMRDPKKFASRKARARETMASSKMQQGLLDVFVKVSKPGIGTRECPKQVNENPNANINHRVWLSKSTARDGFLPQSSTSIVQEQYSHESHSSTKTKAVETEDQNPPKPKAKSKTRRLAEQPSVPISKQINPWTLSQRPSDTLDVDTMKMKRYSTLGLYNSPKEGTQNSSSSYPHSTQTQSFGSGSYNPGCRPVRPVPLSLDCGAADQSSSSTKREVIEISSSPVQICKTRGDGWFPKEGYTQKPQHPEVYDSFLSSNLSTTETVLTEFHSHPEENGFAIEGTYGVKATSQLDVHPSSSPISLPSPSALMSPPWLTNAVSMPGMIPYHDTAPALSSVALKRHVKLRESLAGTYKVVDKRDSKETTSSRIFESVGHVDLT